MKKILAITALLVSACGMLMAADNSVELHGYMQNRFYSGSGANTQFRSERISLIAKAALPNDSLAYVEVYYHPWTSSNGLYLESAYYETPVADSKLKIGKGRRTTFGMTPSYGNRKTTNYGIVAEAMTQDRVQGVQYAGKNGQFDYALGLHTGYRLGIRNIGDIPGDDLRNTATSSVAGNVVPHLCFRDPHSGGGNATQTPNQLSSKVQVSGRVGATITKGLTAGLSGSFATLDARDLANINGSAGSDNVLRPRNPITGVFPTTPLGGGFSDDKMSQIGLDLTYKMPKGLVFQTEWYRSNVSSLDYNAWDILGGYEMASGWKFYVRYSKQDMDLVPTDNPLSWDVNQTSLSAVQPLRKNLWLQYEYEINKEKTNTGGSVANDIFFVELFSAF
ncbi:MAG: hypothetical protein ACYC0V_06685 [Armatimonadota bacterium]